MIRQPHYKGEVALDYGLAVKAERGGYHLRLDEWIADLISTGPRAEFEYTTQPRSIIRELA